MRIGKLALLAVLGSALLGATVLQARNMGGERLHAEEAAAAAADGALGYGVAAEGRVVAYPGAEVKVAAERAGRLLKVHVTEGQKVAKGAVLAEIDADELHAALDQARAQIAEAEASIRLAEQNLDRRRALVAQQIATPHDLDQATHDLDAARARRETARAQAALYDAQLAKTRVLAPIAGTVITRHADGGETVEAGAAITTLADLSRLRIEGEADEADAARLELGAPVVIRADGYPGQTWKGRIEEIADSVTIRRLKPQDPSRPTDTRVLAVKVAFAEKTPLRLGTTVDLRLLK